MQQQHTLKVQQLYQEIEKKEQNHHSEITNMKDIFAKNVGDTEKKHLDQMVEQ